MALTPLRWIALAVLGCAIAFFGLIEVKSRPEFETRSRRRTESDPVEKRLADRASGGMQNARRLATQYRALHIMDSVKRVAARAPDTGAVRIFVDATYPAEMRSMVDSMIHRALRLKSGTGAVGLDIYSVFDPSTHVRGVERNYSSTLEVRYGIPVAAGQRCRVYLRTTNPSVANVRRLVTNEAAGEQLLGPCAFYAAFGHPGPRIQEWLLTGGWFYTVDGSWTVAPHRPTRNLEDPSIFKGPSYALYALDIETGAAACLAGEPGACEAIMHRAPARSRARPGLGDATAPLNLGGRRYLPLSLGPNGAEFLSDAVRDMGRDKFRTFWTSSDSLHVAFGKAAGTPWPVWIRRWMAGNYGTMERGPRPTPLALMLSVLLVGAAIAVSLRAAVTRRYA